MSIGETIGAVLVLLMALYGCAQLIRHICLWLTGCPRCAWCCRLAVPRDGAALAPLLRCLESQSVWADATGCRHTWVLLPELDEEQQRQLPTLLREAPSVHPVTVPELEALLEDVRKQEC